jgi:hypothetical protein
MKQKYKEISSEALESIDINAGSKTIQKELHQIHFDLRNVSVSNSFNVHETQLKFFPRKEILNEDIQLDISSKKLIVATLDESTVYPFIYPFQFLSKEEDFLIAYEWDKTVQIRLTSGEPHDSQGFIWSDKYPGELYVHICNDPFAPSKEFYFDLKMPKEQFNALINVLESKVESRISISLSLTIMAFEDMDRLIINRNATCFINSISLDSEHGVHLVDEYNFSRQWYQNTTTQQVSLNRSLKQLTLNNRLLILIGLIGSFFLIKQLYNYLL